MYNFYKIEFSFRYESPNPGHEHSVEPFDETKAKMSIASIIMSVVAVITFVFLYVLNPTFLSSAIAIFLLTMIVMAVNKVGQVKNQI